MTEHERDLAEVIAIDPADPESVAFNSLPLTREGELQSLEHLVDRAGDDVGTRGGRSEDSEEPSR